MHLVAQLADWWGLSFPQTLLVLALILILVDIFLQSDVPTHLAYILASVAVAYWTPVHILFRIIVGLLTWGALVYVHYAFWRSVVVHFMNRVVAPTKYRSGSQGLTGAAGTVKEINGKKMVSVQGDLWEFESPQPLAAGARVRIVREKGGVLIVEHVKEES